MTGIPLFWSREYKTSTTWRASFVTEEQFKKTSEGPLANLCRLQDKFYDSDDDDDDDDDATDQEPKGTESSCSSKKTNPNIYIEEIGEISSDLSIPSAVCSSLGISSPLSDITACSDDTLETISTLKVKDEEDQEIQEPQCELKAEPELQTISHAVHDGSHDGESTCAPVRTTLTDSNIQLHDKLYSRADDKTHIHTNVSYQNETNCDTMCVCLRAQRIHGLHRTSPSPFSSIRIHESKQTLITSNNECPQAYMKAPLYVIPELQELGLQSSSPQ